MRIHCSERQKQQLNLWNRTATPYQDTLCVFDLVAHRPKRTLMPLR